MATLCALVVPARAGESAGWAAGVDLAQQLSAPLTVAWRGTPVARALADLAHTQHVAILRDRRVDPDQPLTLAIDGQPLADALGTIAGHLEIGYCQFGPVAYFGPASTAARLRTVAALRLDDVRQLPPAVAHKFLLLRAWHWDELAEPRDLVAQLAAEAKVELVGNERIAHDLWPEVDLPPLTWIDRLSLVAGQFDLTFRIDRDGKRVELVDMPARALLARSYLGGPSAAAVARRWQQALPEAKVTLQGNQIVVAGRVEDHDEIERRLRGTATRKTTVTAGREVYQLSVENAALDQLVEQLTQRLNLTFQWDRAATGAAGIAPSNS